MPEQFLLEYGGFSAARGRCHVVLDRASSYALVGDPRDNPGTSVKNAIEQIAFELRRKLSVDVGEGGLYHYDPWDPRLRRSHTSCVEFRGAAWSMPVWHEVETADGFVAEALALVHTFNPYALSQMSELVVVNPVVRLRIEADPTAYDLIARLGTIEHISQRRLFYVDVEAQTEEVALAAARAALASRVRPEHVQVTSQSAPLDQPGTLPL